MSARIALRHEATRPPIGQALVALAVTALVTGLGCLWTTVAAPADARTLMGASLGSAAILLCAAVAAAAYFERDSRRSRDRVTAMEASIARLADAVPAVVHRVRDGASVETALAKEQEVPGVAGQRILWAVAQEIGQGERRRAAAMSACANAAGRVQALATSMLADLREMEERHDEEVLGDLLRLDHNTAQVGRLADSIAVLTGARSGRRWTKPIVMESILRGAVGRIGAYQRVRLHSTLNVAVVGYAAEGVMHALAELMDNAAKFSPPSEQVYVYAEDVHAGVVITIEDGGLAMSQSALRRAERAVSAEPLDLATLSGTRLGLAVVGCLARKHGLTVSFRPSARGGTGVIVMIPRMLITEPREDSFSVAPPAPPAASAVRAAGASGSPAPPGSPSAPSTEDDTSGDDAPGTEAEEPAQWLPKRRRGATFAASAAPTTAVRPAQPRQDAGSRFSAFREAAGRGVDRDESSPASPADDSG
ncbi:MAG TPA: ATP-binding protein [Streptosporangiaceae bacterium]